MKVNENFRINSWHFSLGYKLHYLNNNKNNKKFEYFLYIFLIILWTFILKLTRKIRVTLRPQIMKLLQ